MSHHEVAVTLIWAHDPPRQWRFLHESFAGIDFGVTTDLTGMSEGEVISAVKQFGRSAQVAGQFKRLLFGTPIGTVVVTASATSVTRNDRRWSIGRVVGSYEYRDKNPNDRHTIRVEWFRQTYMEGEMSELIGINPAGRRSAVTPLGVVDASKLNIGIG